MSELLYAFLFFIFYLSFDLGGGGGGVRGNQYMS